MQTKETQITMDTIITNHLLHKDKNKLKGHKIGPSEISSCCSRQVVLGRSPEAVAEAEEPTLKGLSAMMIGTAIHEYFQEKVFKENGEVEIIEAEKYICSEYVNGYIDGVIRFIRTNIKALLEIKTVNQVKYDKMKTSGKPLPEYIEQLTLYEGHEGIYEGYIFVINRGIFERGTAMSRALLPITGTRPDEMFLVFKVTYKEALYIELINRAKEQMKAISDYKEFGIIPDKPGMCTPNGFPCLWCRFKHFCWKGMYQEVAATEIDTPTRNELLDLFKEHMKYRGQAKLLNEKLEASEKALNKFFRLNGKKGFSAVAGENYVIGTDGSLYIEKIEPGRIKKDYSKVQKDPELIVIKPSVKDLQLTLEQSITDVEAIDAEIIEIIMPAVALTEKPAEAVIIEKKKRGRPKKEKCESKTDKKKEKKTTEVRPSKKTSENKKKETEPEVPMAIPSENDYVNEIFASLSV